MLRSTCGLDIARGREVIIVPSNFIDGDDFDETLSVFARTKCISDLFDGFVGNKILRPAFLKFVTSVDEDDFALAVLWFVAVEDDDDSGGGRVVDMVILEQDHALDDII